MPAIQTTDLRKSYGDLTALSGLSLTVEEGELFGLLGPNGSGKTTTIEILTGQRRPTSGTARVLGLEPATDSLDVRRAVGVLPEREDPPSFLTPREYLEFVAEVRDLADVDERIADWADRLEFAETLDTLATDLSEGQRQRVMLASAFLHEPELVFIDEPLVNLDPIMQEQVKRHLVEYCERGNTVFLSTHYVDVARELCTHVGIVGDGKLVAECDPSDFERDELLDFFVAEVGPDRDAAVSDRRPGAESPTTEDGGQTGPEDGRSGTEADGEQTETEGEQAETEPEGEP